MVDGPWSLESLRAQWRTNASVLVSLGALVGMSYFLEAIVGLDRFVPGPLSAAALAAMPALLWLSSFAVRARQHQAPAHFVAGVAALGLFVTGPLANFILTQAVPPLGLATFARAPLALTNWVYAILVVALIQELCKYAAVRYSAYLAPEFREPADGVVYMMACGIGFSVWINYHRFVDDQVELALGRGMAEAVVTMLAHAAFAAVLGAVMGRARFSRRKAAVRGVLLAVGLLGAAAANGTFHVLRAALGAATLTAPGRAVLFAAGFAMLAYVGANMHLRAIMRRRSDV